MNLKIIFGKLKETTCKAKEKLVEIDRKYPWAKYAAIICGSYGVYCLGRHIGQNETVTASVEYIKENYREAYDIIVGNKAPGERTFAKSIIEKNLDLHNTNNPVHQKFIQHWEEAYRENLEKLIEFTKDLDMKPCEALTVGYWVDPNSENDTFRHYVIQQCGNNGHVKFAID